MAFFFDQGKAEVKIILCSQLMTMAFALERLGTVYTD